MEIKSIFLILCDEYKGVMYFTTTMKYFINKTTTSAIENSKGDIVSEFSQSKWMEITTIKARQLINESYK